MVNPSLIAQLQQLAGQLIPFQQTAGNLKASNTTLTTRIANLEAESNTLTIANMTLTAQVANLSGGTAAGDAAGGGTGTAPPALPEVVLEPHPWLPLRQLLQL
jgi:hypothetical protein